MMTSDVPSRAVAVLLQHVHARVRLGRVALNVVNPQLSRGVSIESDDFTPFTNNLAKVDCTWSRARKADGCMVRTINKRDTSHPLEKPIADV